MEYKDKLIWLADKLKDQSNPNDQGWRALARALGLGSSSHLKARLNKKKFTTEQDLAAQMLMAPGARPHCGIKIFSDLSDLM